MKSDQSYLIQYTGRKPLRFKVPASKKPMTFTISPHVGEAIVTIAPTSSYAVTPETKPVKNIFSRENVQGILRALRAELSRRDNNGT